MRTREREGRREREEGGRGGRKRGAWTEDIVCKTHTNAEPFSGTAVQICRTYAILLFREQ